MAIEYKVQISEKQRKLIMRALTAAMANNRRSSDAGFDAAPDEWMELIGVFAVLNSHQNIAATVDHARTSGEVHCSLGGKFNRLT
jgi:hypothetical protein